MAALVGFQGLTTALEDKQRAQLAAIAEDGQSHNAQDQQDTHSTDGAADQLSSPPPSPASDAAANGRVEAAAGHEDGSKDEGEDEEDLDAVTRQDAEDMLGLFKTIATCGEVDAEALVQLMALMNIGNGASGREVVGVLQQQLLDLLDDEQRAELLKWVTCMVCRVHCTGSHDASPACVCRVLLGAADATALGGNVDAMLDGVGTSTSDGSTVATAAGGGGGDDSRGDGDGNGGGTHGGGSGGDGASIRAREARAPSDAGSGAESVEGAAQATDHGDAAAAETRAHAASHAGGGVIATSNAVTVHDADAATKATAGVAVLTGSSGGGGGSGNAVTVTASGHGNGHGGAAGDGGGDADGAGKGLSRAGDSTGESGGGSQVEEAAVGPVVPTHVLHALDTLGSGMDSTQALSAAHHMLLHALQVRACSAGCLLMACSTVLTAAPTVAVLLHRTPRAVLLTKQKWTSWPRWPPRCSRIMLQPG